MTLVLRGTALLAAVAALAAPAAADAWSQKTRLFPGVTYTKHFRWAYGGPLVLHVVVGPKPGGLYDLRPVLAGGRITGRATLSSMQRRRMGRANAVGVNGDFFSWARGHLNGMLLRRGVLDTSPNAARSSLAVGADGVLRVERIRFAGSWGAEDSPAVRLRQLNRSLPSREGYALFTRRWGARTPRARYAYEAILNGLARTVPNRPRRAVVVRLVRGSGHFIPPGGAVLQARGEQRRGLRTVARPGTTLQLAFGLDPWWDGVESAIGGGPLLVRGGRPVFRAEEAFTTYQLVPRHPRTAVGQLADGRIVLVAVDGRSTASWGLTIAQLAEEMARLGAVEAMALDGGGSTTMAVNGRVLNDPSDGSERAVADSLQLLYYGVHAPPPRYGSFSPDGDGVRDVQRLAARLVRPARVDFRLLRPDRSVAWRLRDDLGRGTFARELRRRSLAEGRWTWLTAATDAAGLTSRMRRTFVVNKTLGFLELSSQVVRLRPKYGGRTVISFRQRNDATTSVVVRRRGGRLVRDLIGRRALPPGRYAVVWNARNASGELVSPGRFLVRVRATNRLGTVALQRRLSVVSAGG
ncbi:MAG TPA: phosphodiester glycosidase family protein [Gaiellaceae bacterium]|nr:phosphodiester glycosidase family protein [Gaiellaceae bacterium]